MIKPFQNRMRLKQTNNWVVFLVLLWTGIAGILLMPCDAQARVSYPLKGSIDLTAQAVDVSLSLDSESSIQLLTKKQPENFAISLKFNHIQIEKFVISTSLEAAFQQVLETDNSSTWKGKWWTRYSLVNFQPIRELSGELQLKSEELTFTNTVVGPLLLQGKIEIVSPNHFSSEVLFQDVDLETLMKWWLKNKESVFGGTISGKLGISGDINNVMLNSKFIVEDVTYKQYSYDKIEASFSGRFPNVVISDCVVTMPEGFEVNLNGPFDLSDQENYKNQILALSRNLLIDESDSALKWTFKGVDDNQSGKTEIKYMRRKNEFFGKGPVNDENFIGLERSLEF